MRAVILVIAFVFYVLFMYEAGRQAGYEEAAALCEAVNDD